MKKLKPINEQRLCDNFERPIKDTLDIIKGKWKISIIYRLFLGSHRFSDIEYHLPGITPRVLSNELKELEMSRLVSRTVLYDDDGIRVSIEYTVTEHGRSLYTVLELMKDWGIKHRKENIGK